MEFLDTLIKYWPLVSLFGGLTAFVIVNYFTGKNINTDHEKRLTNVEGAVVGLSKVADHERRIGSLEETQKTSSTVLHSVELSVKGIETKMDILLSNHKAQ